MHVKLNSASIFNGIAARENISYGGNRVFYSLIFTLFARSRTTPDGVVETAILALSEAFNFVQIIRPD